MTCPCSALHWSLECPTHGPMLERSLENDKLWREATDVVIVMVDESYFKELCNTL